MSIEELEAEHQAAGRRLADAHWDALIEQIHEAFPDATTFTTEGTYEEVGADLSVHLTGVYNSGGEEIGSEASDYEFEARVIDHLNWLGIWTPGDWDGEHTHDIPSYRYVKLCAVLRLNSSYDAAEDITTILPAVTPFGEVMFACTADGYNGEFDALGADPTSWFPL